MSSTAEETYTKGKNSDLISMSGTAEETCGK